MGVSLTCWNGEAFRVTDSAQDGLGQVKVLKRILAGIDSIFLQCGQRTRIFSLDDMFEILQVEMEKLWFYCLISPQIPRCNPGIYGGVEMLPHHSTQALRFRLSIV